MVRHHRDANAPSEVRCGQKDAGRVAPRNRRQSAATLPDMGKISLPRLVYPLCLEAQSALHKLEQPLT